MKSLFYDIHRTVMNALEHGGYSLKYALKMLGISRSWYYEHLTF